MRKPYRHDKQKQQGKNPSQMFHENLISAYEQAITAGVVLRGC
jgi:hypothetical protein